MASKPLEVIAIDFTVLDKVSDGRENVLVVTDVYSISHTLSEGKVQSLGC